MASIIATDVLFPEEKRACARGIKHSQMYASMIIAGLYIDTVHQEETKAVVCLNDTLSLDRYYLGFNHRA